MNRSRKIKSDKKGVFWKVYFKVIAIPRYLLQLYFKFYPFNLIPTQSKTYCLDIIAHLNKRTKRENVAEIGCGLGDILRNLNFNHKFGFDKQIEVLNALSFLNRFYRKKNQITLSPFIFGKDSLAGKYDAIILVNWIHKISSISLIKTLHVIFDKHLNQGGEIIIDSVHGDKKIYPYEHNFEQIMKELNCDKKILGYYTMGRNFEIIRTVASFQKN